MTNEERDQMEREAAAAWPVDSMTHDPRDVETMARLLCEAQGVDPDHAMQGDVRHGWQFNAIEAASLLDALHAKGWKITDKHSVESGVHSRWDLMHDAAPICPRDEQ